MTAPEVAAVLGLDAAAVLAIPVNRLARYKFGRLVRFDQADVDAYRRACARELAPPLTPAVLRKYQALRRRAAEVGPIDSLAPLTPEQEAIAAQRFRRMKPPAWADRAAIAATYEQAKRLTEETGIVHHVDHIVPLMGELVSGLHVHNNLQILTRTENLRKRNKFQEHT